MCFPNLIFRFKYSHVTLSSRVCSLCDRARLSCQLQLGLFCLPPSFFPRSSFLSSAPFLPLLSAHTQHTLAPCLLRARGCAGAHAMCPLPFSPCPLRSSVTCRQSPPRPYSCGQQAKRYRPEHQASAGRVPPVIGDPASRP